jgi:hypothetical protein
MRELDFAGLLADAENAVRQPDFGAVRRRARRVRRRRAAASVAGALAAVLVASGLGYAAAGGPGGPPIAATPTPSTAESPGDGWPRVAALAAGAPDRIFTVVERCRRCEPELYASADAGRHWQRRTLPPEPPGRAAGAGGTRWFSFTGLGGDVLSWRDGRVMQLSSDPASPVAPIDPKQKDANWISVDGGRTWRVAEVGANPIGAVPPGTRVVDCAVVGRSGPCLVYAVDPATGRIAPLAHQPSGITLGGGWTFQVNAASDTLWVAGLDPVTRKPAVASSADRGRTWRTHVFSGGVPAVESDGFTPTMYLPMLAAGSGGTAYALLYHDDSRLDAYRTVDGSSWQQVPGTVPAGPDAGLVTADGAHVVVHVTESSTQLLASRDGGRYAPTTLPGYPYDAGRQKLVWDVVSGLYLHMHWSVPEMYVSVDGRTWRTVHMP